MEDDYGSNDHAGLEKSVCFMECPLRRGFVIRDSLEIRPEQNCLFVLERCPLWRMSALGRFHCSFKGLLELLALDWTTVLKN